MRRSQLTTQSMTGFLRSLGHARINTFSESHSSLSIRGASIRRALIVEVRDEVFACLNSLFQDHGVLVARAESSTALAERAASFRADLVLINADQPDENGWLTCSRVSLRTRGNGCGSTRLRNPYCLNTGSVCPEQMKPFCTAESWQLLLRDFANALLLSSRVTQYRSPQCCLWGSNEL